MTKLVALATCCVLLLATPSLAERATFTTESASPLKLSDTDAEEVTHFEGTAQISGRFVAAWERDDEDNEYLRVVLRPDRASAAILPYEERRGHVQEVWLRNTGEALSKLLPRGMATDLLAKRLRRVEADATVEIAEYQTGVDCDQRGYNAKLLSGRPTARITWSARTGVSRGC